MKKHLVRKYLINHIIDTIKKEKKIEGDLTYSQKIHFENLATNRLYRDLINNENLYDDIIKKAEKLYKDVPDSKADVFASADDGSILVAFEDKKIVEGSIEKLEAYRFGLRIAEEANFNLKEVDSFIKGVNDGIARVAENKQTTKTPEQL